MRKRVLVGKVVGIEQTRTSDFIGGRNAVTLAMVDEGRVESRITVEVPAELTRELGRVYGMSNAVRLELVTGVDKCRWEGCGAYALPAWGKMTGELCGQHEEEEARQRAAADFEKEKGRKPESDCELAAFQREKGE